MPDSKHRKDALDAYREKKEKGTLPESWSPGECTSNDELTDGYGDLRFVGDSKQSNAKVWIEFWID